MANGDSSNIQPLFEAQSPILRCVLSEFFHQNHKILQRLNVVVSLLEEFKHERRRFDLFGQCNVDFSVLCFECSRLILSMCENLAGPNLEPFVSKVKEVLKSLESLYAAMRKLPSSALSMNLLAGRFQRLKSNSNESESSLIQALDRKSYVSPQEVMRIFQDTNLTVLLIDIRTLKEFVYSHVKGCDIINIEPEFLSSSLRKNPSLTDDDFEKSLELIMDESCLKHFKNRMNYDLIICYNLRFRVELEEIADQFKQVFQSIVQGQETKTPFSNLFEILVFRNKYLSSRIKHYPLILNGGLEKWFKTFGDDGIIHSSTVGAEESARATQRRDPDNSTKVRSDNAYVKTFGDYLGQPVKKLPTKGAVSFQAKAPEARSHKSAQSLTPIKVGETNVINEMSNLPAKVDQSLPTNIIPWVTGLTNLGNTCYMNCVLQCLAATPALLHFFLAENKVTDSAQHNSYKRHINVTNVLGSRGLLTTGFVDLLIDMRKRHGNFFNPTKFRNLVGSMSPDKQFAGGDQQDCIEFLNFVLDTIHEDLNQRHFSSQSERALVMELSEEQERSREKLPVRLAATIEWERYLKVNFSVIVDLFQGQLLSRLQCLECRNTSTTYNSFSTLSLPIPRHATNSAILLADCLDMFTQVELLDDENKWFCSSCKRFTRLTKEIRITRLPKVLIIHFKRFRISSGKFKKIETLIRYPVEDEMSLTQYWPPVGTYLDNHSRSALLIEEEVDILARFPTRSQVPPFRYKLFGVVNHFGNLTTGHYTSYVKSSGGAHLATSWNYFDDARVSHNCKADRVMNRNAYCLFFLRI